MDWCAANGIDDVFDLPGNTVGSDRFARRPPLAAPLEGAHPHGHHGPDLSIIELALRTGRVPPKYIYDSLEWNALVFDGKEISLAVVKDHSKRYFELLIWTLLLYERPFTGKSVTTPRQSFTLKGYVSHP
jgi:hypothetical protein